MDIRVCIVTQEELVTLEELMKPGTQLKTHQTPGPYGIYNEIIQKGHRCMTKNYFEGIQYLFAASNRIQGI